MPLENHSVSPKPPPPELEELGWRVKKIRCDLGMSRAELASRLNLDVHQLGKIERGRRDLSTLLLCRVAAVLRCDAESLLRGISAGGDAAREPLRPPVSESLVLRPPEARDITREEIKDFRKRHGLTQRQLGSLCGVKQSTVVRWEAGEGIICNSSSILLQELLEGRRNLVPLTVAEERLLDEIVVRGNFETREAFFTRCLLDLLKQREIAGGPEAGPRAGESS